MPNAPLLQLARAELHRAKQLRTARWSCHAATFLIGVVGLWLSGNASYVVSFLAVLSEVSAWSLRQQSHGRHQRAEQGKRIAELRRFYDPATAGGAESDFRSGVSKWACQHAHESRFDDASYWDSKSGVGRDPLRRAVREAAWWSSNLYDEGRKLASLVAGTAVALAVAIVFAFLFTGFADAAEEVARITLLVIAGLVGADALTVRADWAAAAAASRSVYEQLTPVAFSDADVFRLYTDYHSMTAGTEPIPQWIYERNKQRLNVAWRAENAA